MDNQQIPKADSEFQKIARKNHRKWKLRLLSKGGQKANSGGSPYDKKPDYNRAKSAPPGFGGSLEEQMYFSSERIAPIMSSDKFTPKPQGEMGSKFSKKLEDLVTGDQKLRNILDREMKSPLISTDKFTPTPQGWSPELVDRFIKAQGTSKGDVFGDKSREKEFANLFPSLDFESFNRQDWNNFNLLIIHLRGPEYRYIRKRALLEMIKAKTWWRDLATDMARNTKMLPEFDNIQLSYPEDTKDGSRVDLLLKQKGITWNQLAQKLTSGAQLNEVIRKKGGKYCLFSKKTKRNLGCYPTRAGAVKREKQVQYFKHLKEIIYKEILSLLEEDKKKKKGKEDRCTRIAKSKYDAWPSAYASGAVVKCRQGKIWKNIKEEEELEEIKKPSKSKYLAKKGVALAAAASTMLGAKDQEKLQKSKKAKTEKHVVAEEDLDEEWSEKYKKSIDCKNPKGFSQRAHCQGRKKRD